jgi:hypothetical protein
MLGYAYVLNDRIGPTYDAPARLIGQTVLRARRRAGAAPAHLNPKFTRVVVPLSLMPCASSWGDDEEDPSEYSPCH